MFPSRDGRHFLVYRCDPNECGRHTAQVDEVEDQLVKEYRAFRVRECWGRPAAELLEGMYASLRLAWVEKGRVCAGAVRFDIPE